MLFLHSVSITQQLMPIYNATVHKKNIVAHNLNLAEYVSATCYMGKESLLTV